MYKANGKSDVNQSLAKHAPLVKKLAHQLKARLPDNVEVDDLVQAGMIGLLDAVQRFEEQGPQFETYAVQRIRGAMLDELRGADWLPRSVRQNRRRAEAALTALQHKLGRPASESEVATALGMRLDEYQRTLADGGAHQLVHYEDFHDPEGGEHFLDRHCVSEGDDPLAILLEEGFRDALAEAIAALPERERTLMALYYQEQLNLAEIGAVLGVTASRVCQLHNQAIARLRVQLREREWTGAA